MKTILLLLALLGASAASRLDHHTVGDAKIDPSLTMAALEEWGEDVNAYLQYAFESREEAKQNIMEDEKAVIATKFIVPPEQHDEFLGKVKQLKESLKEEHGNEIFSVAKTKTDNLFFLSYTVWKSWDHLIEHAKSGECKDFIEYTKKANIAWFKKPLCIVA